MTMSTFDLDKSSSGSILTFLLLQGSFHSARGTFFSFLLIFTFHYINLLFCFRVYALTCYYFFIFDLLFKVLPFPLSLARLYFTSRLLGSGPDFLQLALALVSLTPLFSYSHSGACSSFLGRPLCSLHISPTTSLANHLHPFLLPQ